MNPIVSLADLVRARARLGAHVRTTPLLESDELNTIVGARVFVKAEALQHAGSFKFRGALNKMLVLRESGRRAGVVAFSSGNHGLAVAEAARLLGLPATVVMPADAPLAKLNGARARGATVVTYDRETDDREEICAGIVAETGADLIPPYDDPDVFAGAGTSCLEAIDQLRPMGVEPMPERVLVCCSGGGLAAGWAIATRELMPEASIFTVEPKGFDDTARSLASGERRHNAKRAGSICDALLAPSPGAITFPILRRCGVQGVEVGDEAVKRAMRLAFDTFKLVLEPGGAAALAAVLSDAGAARPSSTLLIASGGNVDAEVYSKLIGEAA